MPPISRRSFTVSAAAVAASASLALGRSEVGSAAALGLAGFQARPYKLHDLERSKLPYISTTAGPLQGSYTFGANGIAVRWIGDKAFDHPVLQAQYMLSRLSSYQINRNPAYLASVEAHAEHLQSYAVRSRGAAYLPYPFDFNLHDKPEYKLPAPWYSGMAQGQALSAFCRLAKETGKSRYREFADALFASFHNLEAGNAPWTVAIDEMNCLWFEEYARPGGASDRAMNGHIFAIYGLYDYWQFTGSPLAKSYIAGGATAAAMHISAIRNPGWSSYYCLAHRVSSAKYHTVHPGQLYQLATITGDTSFNQIADDFIEDYPTAQEGGKAYIGSGTHDVLTATSRPAATAIVVDKAESATCDKRGKLAGFSGVFLRITSGSLKDCWVREIGGKSFIRLYIEGYRFGYQRLVNFDSGSYTGYKFNANGGVAERKTIKLTRSSAAHVSQRAVCNGTLHYKVADGWLSGWWIRAGKGIDLK